MINGVAYIRVRAMVITLTPMSPPTDDDAAPLLRR